MCLSKICPHCKIEKPLKEFYNRRNSKENSSYCKECTKSQSITRQRNLKREAVEYLGSKCIKCGYDSYIGALEFHHLDPKEKEFNISKFKGYKFKSIKEELDKCILLCANCHREIHSDVYKEQIVEWKVEKKKSKEEISLDSYQQPIHKTKIEWPSDEELSKLVWKYPRSHLAKVFQVSDVAISKYLKRRNISQPPRGYWSKIKKNNTV